MRKISILWVDDEIDLLKAHIIFLEEKGYEVNTASNGADAIEMQRSTSFDIIFLDENMPGMNGLETLGQIKAIDNDVPIVMITKSEAEDIMEEAIASKINDYLIKPVNPNQVLLSIKKNIDTKRLVSEKTTSNYQMEFSKIGMQINDSMSFSDWQEIYKKLVYWDIELEKSGSDQMKEILQMQKDEANLAFSKYVKRNYVEWFEDEDKRPLISPAVMQQRVFPLLESGEPIFLIVIDNLRYDQWKVLQNYLKDYYKVDNDEIYCSILPTTTQYARNAFFAGLMPYEMDKILPDYWMNDEDEGGKNTFEEDLLKTQLTRNGLELKTHFQKIFNKQGEKKVLKNYKNLMSNDLNVLIYNFIDILSHAKTNVQMVKELADDESAYRSLTASWFNHSYLYELLKNLSEEKVKVVITTDHGSIKVDNAVKVMGEREATSNLRFKAGKHLKYNPKEVFEITDIKKAHLPERNISFDYIFATSNDYFVYPSNYNQFANYYNNTFQHGGVSLEEMLVPFIVLNPLK